MSPPGIIPARAGFTRPPTRTPAASRDHPRSRGVYLGWIVLLSGPWGSSPLARGLLHRALTGLPAGRIIPARAGFTAPTGRPHGGSRDHPRSRGVYLLAVVEFDVGGGSSPLARGLPAPLAADRPAPLDHPRSRGVYPPADRVADHDAGSSPLARGLPEFGRIAARFGGSSPLARGLPELARAERPAVGIIPARAGFTARRRCPRRRPRDHPRSRGVYRPEIWGGARSAGSSPLARGLRERPRQRLTERRIIPARAGFTPASHGPRRAPRDHPRSRGVYFDFFRSDIHSGGSSPLARGLPGGDLPGEAVGGIIPARAGFTGSPRTPSPNPTDHPRSRGVYPGCPVRGAHRGGSSPLARGLRRPCPA